MGIGTSLRKHFLLGILVVAPLATTVLILVWVFTSIDNILQPVVRPILGRNIPGLGFAIMVVIIYLAGFTASTVVGRKLINYGEYVLERLPVVRMIYIGIKQIVDSFSTPGKAGFQQVVLVEFPMKGTRTIGFVTNESPDQHRERILYVFIPTAPNPTSGFLQIVREEDVIRTDISIDDALKVVVSAGKVLPPEISNKVSFSITRDA